MWFLIDCEGKPYNSGIREMGVVLVSYTGTILKSWIMTDDEKISKFLKRNEQVLVWGSFDKHLAEMHNFDNVGIDFIDVSCGLSLNDVCDKLGIKVNRPRHNALMDALTMFKVLKKVGYFNKLNNKEDLLCLIRKME